MKRIGAGLLIAGAALALLGGFTFHNAPWTVTGVVFAVIGLILFIYAEKQGK